jgi:hypothetical protein
MTSKTTKLILQVWALCLIAILGLPAAAYADSNTGSTSVKFDDPVLEQAVKTELQITDGAVTKYDMLKLKSFFPKTDSSISSLTGLETAANLTNLYLPKQKIQDLAPLSKLRHLSILALNGNQIENVCPLSGLASLKKLIVSGNRIGDISCLSGLTSLTDLLAGDNTISDIQALGSMKQLRWANLEKNQIVSIAGLAGHPSLEHLYLGGNQIADESPLLRIPQLYDIHLNDTPADSNGSNVRSALENGGASVNIKGAATKFSVIPVFLDKERIRFDRHPFVDNDVTFVQFRPLFETFGLKVDWKPDTQTIIGTKMGLKLELTIGSTDAFVNGKKIQMPAAPQIVSDSTFVPTRFIGEALGYDVNWDGDKNAVRIYTDKQLLLARDGETSLKVSHKWKPSVYEASEHILIFAIDPAGRELLEVREDKETIGISMSIQDYTDAVKKAMLSIGVDYTFSIPEPRSVGGKETLVFDYNYTEGKKAFRAITAIIETENSFYKVALVGPAAEFEEISKEFDELLPTFKEMEPMDNLADL